MKLHIAIKYSPWPYFLDSLFPTSESNKEMNQAKGKPEFHCVLFASGSIIKQCKFQDLFFFSEASVVINILIIKITCDMY